MGQVNLKFNNGDKYKGQIKDWKFEGKGTYT